MGKNDDVVEWIWMEGWLDGDCWEGKGEREGRRTAKQTNRQTSDHSAAAAVRAAMPKGQRATTWPIKVTHERVRDALEEGKERGGRQGISARRGDIIEWTASNGADIVAGTGSGPNGIWMHQRQQQHSTQRQYPYKNIVWRVCVCCQLWIYCIFAFRKQESALFRKWAGQRNWNKRISVK